MAQPITEDGMHTDTIDTDNLTATERRTYHTQETFLRAYEKEGTITRAANAVGISREIVRRWRNNDHLDFAQRFRDAQDVFGDELESILFERLRNPKENPVLLIFALKAHRREKYGDTAVPTDTTAADTMKMLAELAKHQQQPTTVGEQQQVAAEEPDAEGILASLR